jgi:four helix bundle protein
MYVETFRDLRVYKKARKLAKEIFQLTKSFPPEEKYSLISQIRKSSRSIGAQIAEAWAKRKYESHFKSKLTDADGEQQETQHWLEVSLDCEYIDKERNGMMDKSGQFCAGKVMEESADYEV